LTSPEKITWNDCNRQGSGQKLSLGIPVDLAPL
jgi:hypothetical protein